MSITWNGVNSDTIGVVVERIPNRYVPTRRFSPQEVAGRNGNILRVDKSFPNVEQEYEVYLSAEAQGLPSVARACAEWLMGPDGYCRLEDSYDTTVYREAFLMGGYDLENILNKFGRCTITFSCKPQKYLLTGDTPISIPAGPTTYTGDVVQFDGVTGASITSLSTTISPIQDLHGYSSPWPAGGGVNRLNPATVPEQGGYIRSNNGLVTSNTSWRYSDYIPVTPGEVLYFGEIYANAVTAGTAYYDSNKVYVSGFSATSLRNSNGVMTVPEGVAFMRHSWQIQEGYNENWETTVYIIPNSSPHEFTPYSNICPITGRTGVTVYRTGKNLYSREDSEYNVPVYAQDGTSASYPDVAVWWFKAKPNTKYTISKKETPSKTTYLRWINCDENKGFISRPVSTYSDDHIPIVITTPADTGWVEIAVNEYATAQIANNDWQIQIEEGNVATAYETFGSTYTSDWTSPAGTVYGGTLDVVTGVLTVTSVKEPLRGSYFSSYSSSISCVYGGKPSGWSAWAQKVGGSSVLMTDGVASSRNDIGNVQNGFFIGDTTGGNQNLLFVKLNGITTDLTTAQNYIETRYTNGNPIEVVYELATPLTYQLTAQEVAALVGENNVWTSSGPVSVTVEAPFSGIVTNPTPFEARPMLEVSGVGEITINGKSIQILESVSDFQIDCEAMEAEDNSKIYCMDFPELSGGANSVYGDGTITALSIVPRWWTL